MAIKTTKNILLSIILLLTLLLFMQACKKKESENSGLVGNHIFKKDKLQTLVENDQKIEVTAIDFEVTGCPINAQCLVGGYSRVKIKFKDNSQEQFLDLCKGLCSIIAKPLAANITLNGIKYNVKLEDILPYYDPERTTIETPKAIIVISKAAP